VASKGKIILRPENPDYDDILLDKRGNVRVLGKVVGLMRRF
jgi:SOS-response transcriptional repressor LexA